PAPSVARRIAPPAGAHLIVGRRPLRHATPHNSETPRYCLITSWTSGPELDAYIAKYNGVSRVPNVEVPQDVLDAGQAEQTRRLAARAAVCAAQGKAEATATCAAENPTHDPRRARGPLPQVRGPSRVFLD